MDKNGRQYLEKENILVKEKKKGEGEVGKYLETENISSADEKENREGKGGNIWRRKINGDTD